MVSFRKSCVAAMAVAALSLTGVTAPSALAEGTSQQQTLPANVNEEDGSSICPCNIPVIVLGAFAIIAGVLVTVGRLVPEEQLAMVGSSNLPLRP